ncbi:MAG: hypothetical protein HYS21_10865 [Deltaproteobacteria bacterium]|nr:hypothetical protein [Deltaproteobacteria bacterium]
MKKGFRYMLALSVCAGLLFSSAQAFSAVPKTNFKKPSASEVKAEKNSTAKVVFDASHSEIFSPVKSGPLNYTEFAGLIKNTGEDISLNRSPVNKKTLEKVKTYIIAGPAKPFTADEGQALKSFVNDGGNLLILLHISQPVAGITGEFGIIVSNFVISEQANTIKGQSQDFQVVKFANHPVTAGLEKIAVFGTWGLMTEQGASVVAQTSDKAWADLNRDRIFEADEPAQVFGIIAVSQHGKGKVVVVADDAPFANQFLGEADNRKLAGNIIKWFKE